jgi:hypothetical protein
MISSAVRGSSRANCVRVGGTGSPLKEVETPELIRRPYPGIIHVLARRKQHVFSLPIFGPRNEGRRVSSLAAWTI